MFDYHSNGHSTGKHYSEKPMKPKNQRPKDFPPVSEYFGELTFGLGEMREKLPKEDYQALLRMLEHGKKFNKDVADSISLVIKEWAVNNGATHFCHWFQPMTGLTAEKHDAFISIQHAYHSELSVIERFTGSQLIQGEPDASSFPSGGMRSTFEARGYTAWDPSSPIFIVEGDFGKTLCIPSIFFGYHGEALDHKTPLLRSVDVLSKNACEFLKLLGDVDVKSISATLGAEQEYFLIDKKFVEKRPDILMTGRTLLGASSPRGQQLEDHYFGSIPTRVKGFMEEVEYELYRLGVPIKTRHNEVAPSQFELAPIFENVNIACDHNALTMETLKRVANRHGLVCLLHEKPFARINGSGKHCNWSMSNDKGENLLDPGNTPHQNLRFLAVLAVVMRAVHQHADCLRAAIATPGNDHRLGGNEAPPAIISIFLGSMLSQVLDSIEKGEAAQATEGQIINLGVSQVPEISRDYTDRNRTSPFAFTGNKFEFRAVGASASIAVPTAILNAAVADSLQKAIERLKTLLKEKKTRDEAVMELTRELTKESKAIRFEGNNYSEEWRKEAKKRGLPILSSTAEALEVFNQDKSVDFLINTQVLTKAEIASRYHVGVERYVKTVEIEIHTLSDMVQEYLIPTIEKQLVTVYATASQASSSKFRTEYQERIQQLEDVFTHILKELRTLRVKTEELSAITSESEKMSFLAKTVMPQAELLRKSCDQAESLVAYELWPLPKYREMLFAHGV